VIFSRIRSLAGWRAHAAAAGFGVLSAAALPPVYAVPVLLVSVPALLALIGARPGWRGAFAIGFWLGFGHHLVGLYWITEAILFEAARFWWLVPLAVPALAAVLALFIAIPCALARLAPEGGRRVLVLAGAWVLADLARQFIATGFPWNLWGSVWEAPGAIGNVFIQPASLVSVHGLTLATILLAATPALGVRFMLAGAVALAGWAGFGAWRLSGATPAPPGINVVLVQGNVAQGQKWDRDLVLEIFQRYLKLTHDGAQQAKAPALVVWPETAFPGLLDSDPQARAYIAGAARSPSFVGTVRFDAQRRPRNSLLALAADGTPVAVYDKWHLVPFGEYQPSWMPLPIQVVPGGGFAAGPGPQTLHVPGVPPVGPIICYEAIFPGQVVDEADRPDWIVNVTNDAWFGNSTGPRQHLAAARMRAVEEGLPLLRAANTGISAAFDAYGREQTRLGMSETGFLVTPLPGHLPPTLFARAGLMLPALLAFATTLLGFLWPRRSRKP
jgi:apolipoprotein N-acyltransferase